MNNTTTSHTITSEVSTGRAVVHSLFYVVLFVFGFIFNLAIIILVHSKRSLQTVTNLWVTSLCVSQLLTCVLALPFAVISSAAKDWIFGGVFCQIYGYYTFVLRTVSILSVAGIAVDRYHLISRPFSKRTERKTARTFIVFCWWSAILICIPPLTGIGLFRYSPNHHICQVSWTLGGPALIYTVFYITTVFVSTLLTTLFSYRLIHKITRIQALKSTRSVIRRSQSHQRKTLQTALNSGQASAHANDCADTRRTSSFLDTSSWRKRLLCSKSERKKFACGATIDKKTNQIIITVIAFFLISWTPYFVFAIYSAVSGGLRSRYSTSKQWIEFLVTWLSLSTCVWDPLLYGACTQNFRYHFRNFFTLTRWLPKKPSDSDFKRKSSSYHTNLQCETCFSDYIGHKTNYKEQRRLEREKGVRSNQAGCFSLEEKSTALTGCQVENEASMPSCSGRHSKTQTNPFEYDNQKRRLSIENPSFVIDDDSPTPQIVAKIHKHEDNQSDYRRSNSDLQDLKDSSNHTLVSVDNIVQLDQRLNSNKTPPRSFALEETNQTTYPDKHIDQNSSILASSTKLNSIKRVHATVSNSKQVRLKEKIPDGTATKTSVEKLRNLPVPFQCNNDYAGLRQLLVTKHKVTPCTENRTFQPGVQESIVIGPLLRKRQHRLESEV